MASLRGAWLRIRSLLRPRLDRDLEDELEFHAEMAAREYVDAGMSPEDARAKARRQFGNRTAIKEAGREMFSLARFETFLQDVRYGARVLIKNPGFSSTAAITLALGIGVNVAIFSLVYGVLLRPLPYQSGERLVVLHQQALGANQSDVPFSVKEIVDYREHNRTLDAVVEHHTMNFLLLSSDNAERVDTAVVSANFFDVLGVQPLLGRTFVASDEEHGADAVLILSNAYWRRRYGSDPNIVGKVFQMNNRPHTVIGVLPPIPQYPVENDVYMPTSQCPTRSSPGFIENRRSRMMTAFGRLKPGVQIEQAQADLSTVAQGMEQANPDTYPKDFGYALAVAPLRKDLTRRAESTFLVLLGAAGLVLLIACANVANLLLARLLAVQKELSLRMALGAGRLRLIRQLLTEGMLLSLAGGALGLALAPATLKLLVKFAERFTTRSAEIKIDTPILLFALLVSVATGILFSLWPAFSSSVDVAESLKSGTGKSTATRTSHRVRSALVVAQIAVSFVLLTGAGLLIRSFVRLQSVNPGFTASQVLTLRLSPNFSRYTQPQQYRMLRDNVLREVAAASGVESAAMAANFPFNPGRLAAGPQSLAFRIEGVPESGPRMLVDRNLVTPSYFQTIRQPLIDGRLFTDQDGETSLPVAVINQTMARHRWPSERAVGKRISFGAGQTIRVMVRGQAVEARATWIEVVGVVGDTKEYGLDRVVADEVYLPVAQLAGGFVPNVVVRTTADPMVVSSNVREALRRVDPQLAVDRVVTIDGLRDESIASPRVTTILLGLFAGLALLISASGIAAVIALSVCQRTRELGIRMALGASRSSVQYLVLRHGIALAIAGSVIGVCGALALTRLVSALLYDTSPTDVLTFAGTSLLFLVVAAGACIVPVRQITAIDPNLALRQE